MIRLLRNINNNAVVEWEPDKQTNAKYVELTDEEVRGYMGHAYMAANNLRTLDPDADGIVLWTTSMGIGDAITVLYAACGLASAGYAVTYNTRHYGWLRGVAHPNLKLQALGANTATSGVDVNKDYMDQLRDSYLGRLKSRSHWALRAIRMIYPMVPATVEPARPAVIPRPQPVEEGDYIVVSPYASIVGPARNWNVANYARLVSVLTAKGYRCFVPITSENKKDEPILNMPGVRVLIDARPDHVVSLVAHARLVIGNDSGIAHLAGLLNTPAFAIMAHVPAPITFGVATSVRGIVPAKRVKCRQCCWQKEGGYIPSCATYCAAMGSILPDDVLDKVLVELDKKGSIPLIHQELQCSSPMSSEGLPSY